MNAGRAADAVIVGGGILGLATARALHQRDPRLRITILEKEAQIASHQSGRNSGVIHAGVYYRPGSEKARLCRDGRREMLAFCADHGIAHEVCGKVVVATSTSELVRLDELLGRCRANGLDARLIDRRELVEREPFVDGLAAIHVPATGIVDYVEVCRALAHELRSAGIEIATGSTVQSIREHDDLVEVATTAGSIRCTTVVNCAGLQSDRIAGAVEPHLTNDQPTILPFRGEYFELRADRRHLVRNLVYPVPDPRFPFLGVHLTRDIHGGVHAGPNAVLALGREAYSWGSFMATDVLDALVTPSTWRLARHHARTGAVELRRSLSKKHFVRALQRLVPDVAADDLVRAPAGIRAQAIAPDGTLLDDFAFAASRRTLHVLNAPSPAATASLAIGREIAARVDTSGGLVRPTH